MSRIFKYLPFLQLPFSILAMYYIFHGSIVRGDNFMEEVGLGILCMGLAFAFGSISDITNVSKKEQKLFANEKKYQRDLKTLVAFGFLFLVVSLFFVSMKWFGASDIANDYYLLGLNCFPNVLAVFFAAKQLQDKKAYFDSKTAS